MSAAHAKTPGNFRIDIDGISPQVSISGTETDLSRRVKTAAKPAHSMLFPSASGVRTNSPAERNRNALHAIVTSRRSLGARRHGVDTMASRHMQALLAFQKRCVGSMTFHSASVEFRGRQSPGFSRNDTGTSSMFVKVPAFPLPVRALENHEH
jgi:hypothetical protein